MKELKSLNKYFWKYRWRFSLGILFVILSNYFGILAPQMTGFVVDQVYRITQNGEVTQTNSFDPLVKLFIDAIDVNNLRFSSIVLFSGLMLLALALLRGFFMFLMRQTIIVMSRHIEFDQKNDVYHHAQQLDAQYFKLHSTGDLMSRMTEDVSRVRMYTGPALMYLVNLSVMIGISFFYMFKKDVMLTLYVLSPLPVLAFAMYFINNWINKKSESIQGQLSDLTTIAQESYSGIRVIKSFNQENASLGYFSKKSEEYRKSGLSLSTMEAIYFPAIGLLIGLSTLLTIYIGIQYQLAHRISAGTIAEFVVYINMLTFPVSAIGWVASNIQRAAASQKRLNEFLHTNSAIQNGPNAVHIDAIDTIAFSKVGFTYPHTGIQAIRNFDLNIQRGQKIAIIGKTGSGKSTLAQLLLRMFDPQEGIIAVNGVPLNAIHIGDLRRQISYVPQDVFLFSETVSENILFGCEDVGLDLAIKSADTAVIRSEIESLPKGFETAIGERGVTLSGGQKQRISIARALAKKSDLLILDDCLSAVDAQTEYTIAHNLNDYLENRTAIIITHRIFPSFTFDHIIVMEDGRISEQGSHDDLIRQNGYYSRLLNTQEGIQ